VSADTDWAIEGGAEGRRSRNAVAHPFRRWRNATVRQCPPSDRSDGLRRQLSFADVAANYEAMAMIRKGQVRNIGGNDIRAQATFIATLFAIAA
jgi:hypothetical protein